MFQNQFPPRIHKDASKKGGKVNAGMEVLQTFGEMCDDWLKTKGRMAKRTKVQYGNALEIWKKIFGEDTFIQTLTHRKVAALIGDHPWTSPRLVNNYLIPLRGVFKMACREIRMADPMIGIENSKRQAKLPDPLSRQEMGAILSWLKANKDISVWAYFEFAFMTGMRPEEIIALKWCDVDDAMGSIRVERARSAGEIKPLKTYQARDVNLVERAKLALEAMKPITYSSENGSIFRNPVTMHSWHDDRSQRDHYWKPALKAARVRYRRAYCTRHTYATLAITAGVNPAYIASQMGHTNARMMFEVYAKWIAGADGGRELAKMEAANSLGALANTGCSPG